MDEHGLKGGRVLRHSCWCLKSTREGAAYGPPPTILPQHEMLGIWKGGRGPHRHPQPKREALPLQTVLQDLQRNQRHSSLYRVHKPHELVCVVVTLLAYGCPVQAIVAGFGLDERTVARWQRESGHQCRRLHEHLVEAGGVLLAQVQADELRIRIVGGVLWLASALSVTNRLWLGGVVQIRRDRALIGQLLLRVRACGAFEDLLLCTDGLAAYPKQALKVLREPLRTGKRGRPRLLLPEGVMVAQALKRYARRRVVGVLRRVVRGTEAEVGERLRYTQGATPPRSSTLPTSSGCRPLSAPGSHLWCAGRGRRHVIRRRWRRACGWSGRSTTSAERIAL